MKRRRLLKWLGLGSIGIFGGGAGYGAYKPGNSYYSGPKSDHFNGQNFFNPGGTEPRSLSDLLKWQLGTSKQKWPATFPSPHHGTKPDRRIGGGEIRVTMVGHATLLIQLDNLNFLTDPVWAERASPVQFAGPRRVNAPGIRFEDLPPIDYVLLSHNHYDHLDLATLKRISDEHSATIICPLGNDAIVKSAVSDAEIRTGDWGEMFDLGNGTRVHFEPCHHWSARGTKDRRWALWSAFLLEAPSGKVYHVGDTGFHDGINYRALLEKHGPVRLAILPVGAYEPRWFMKGQHQNPEEAVRGHKLLEAEHSIGHHWGTFQLTNEAIEAPVEALDRAREKLAVAPEAFPALRPGEVWSTHRTGLTS